MPSTAPQFDPAAEKAVIGSVLLDGTIANDLASHPLAPEHFFSGNNAIVYRAVLDLADNHVPIDTVSLRYHLQRTGDLDTIGGPPALLDYSDAAPTSANWRQYADIVHNLATYRQLEAAGLEIGSLAREASTDPRDVLARSQTLLESIETIRDRAPSDTFGDLMDLTVGHAEERAANPGISGIPTGFIEIDELLGGLVPGRLYVLGARPSVGKSSWAENVVVNVAKLGVPVYLFELEQSRRDVAMRMACAQACLDSVRAQRGTLAPHQLQHLRETAATMRDLPIRIDDDAAVHHKEMARRVHRWRPDDTDALVVVDYLQLGGYDERSMNRTQGVGAISRTLKETAKREEVPVIALSQLNREVEKMGRRPNLSDLRDSGEVEQDADAAAFLHAQLTEDSLGGYPTPPAYEWILAKQWTRFFTTHNLRR